jgi:serine/threonine protein phosphatase 1
MKMQKFERNRVGLDYVVGDIHGCFDRLRIALDQVGFDKSKDRLFSVGDLVDRGPASLDAMDWLDQPWFFAVRGNHEQMAINFEKGHNHAFQYERNGGRWFINLDAQSQFRIAQRFNELPYAIEVDTPNGTFGIVHAEVPGNNWLRLRDPGKEEQEIALWERDRYMDDDQSLVEGIDRVYVGHTPVKRPVQLGNVFYIDTGAVFGGALTIVCLTDDRCAMQEAA